MNTAYEIIVVGGGVAGLTATAYLAKAGYNTLLCEMQAQCGGLVNSFEHEGFTFDGGIRAIEDSGILLTMLSNLGLEIELIPNHVTIGIEDRIIRLEAQDAIGEYEDLLIRLYPDCTEDITAIIKEMRTIMHYMRIQYGIKNPAFLDIKADRDYFFREILPWMLRYAFTLGKVVKRKVPVVEYLRRFTQNQSLLDIITQHFFTDTPAFFALSYFSLYLDYYYPNGGTGKFSNILQDFAVTRSATIHTQTRISSVDAAKRTITDHQGNTYQYEQLIWAADLKTLYEITQTHGLETSSQQAIAKRQALLADKHGGDSVFTLYAKVDLPPTYFGEIASAHVFYTPDRTGQTKAGPLPHDGSRSEIEAWLQQFLELTTYEISIPVLRDANLAPKGKTGLIISMLFDYDLTERIHAQGWYDDFKLMCGEKILDVLNASLYPGLKDKATESFAFTPRSMAEWTGNTDGALTGWAFTNMPMPAEHRMLHVTKSVYTPIPHVFQAGQWTFSPAGFPSALLSGKLAFDQIQKLRK